MQKSHTSLSLSARCQAHPFRAAVIGGLMLGASFPSYPGIHLEILSLVALIPILLAIRHASAPRKFYAIAFAGMMAFTCLVAWWLLFATVAGAFLLWIPMTLVMTVPLVAFFIVRRARGWRFALWTLPLFWTAWEWIYLDLEASYGWLTLGNSHATIPVFVQYADITGVMGISFWIVLFNILILRAIESWEEHGSPKRVLQRLALILGCMVLPPILYSAYTFMRESLPVRTTTISIIQPNVDPFEKWDPELQPRIMLRLFALTDSAVHRQKPDLVLWPETAIPYYILLPTESMYKDTLFALVSRWDTPLLTGFSDARYYPQGATHKPSSHHESETGLWFDIYNSAMLIQPGDPVPQIYHKVRLVPFAERAPYSEYFPFIQNWTFSLAGVTSWDKGDGPKLLRYTGKDGKGVAICGLICYENVYPGFTAEFVRQGAQALTVMTNDGWFAKSYGPYQHAAVARLRCIENRRAMARSANTGISMFIDRYGRAYGEVPWWQEQISTREVELSTELTFYTRFPDLLPKGCAVIGALALVFVLPGLFRKSS